MKKANLILAMLAMVLMLAACSGKTPGPDTKPEEPKPLESVPEELQGTYDSGDGVVFVLGDMSIKINDTELATPEGVKTYVDGVLAEARGGLKGQTIDADTVSYATTGTAIEITFGGLKGDEPGTGTLSFSKVGNVFYFGFSAEVVINEYVEAESFAIEIPTEGTTVTPDDPEVPVESEFTEVQEALYGTYTYDTVITIAKGSIKVDDVEVTTPAGVADYVAKILSGSFSGLTVDLNDVQYAYTADSAVITFGLLGADEGSEDNNGSMSFKKAASGNFYYTFKAQAVIEGSRLTQNYSCSYGPEAQS